MVKCHFDLSLKDEIEEWLRDNNYEYAKDYIIVFQFGEFNIRFDEKQKAVLFKMTWL